jgi:hypothetical protein
MGEPISRPFAFTTRQYYDIDGDPNVANDATLSFEELDTTLLFLSSSIATVGTPFIGLTTASVNLNTINFTKSNGDTFPITVDTGSGQTYLEGLGIDINSNYISASIGAGLRFDINSKIEATVRTVNGAIPDETTGNITTALTAVLTGPSASGVNNLIASSSGTNTGSITNATVWVVSGDSSTPSPNGLAYIFVSQSTDLAPPAGKWFPLSTLNQDQADLRYVELSSATIQTITSSLLISGSTTFSGSLFWSGASSLDGATNYVLVLDDNGQIYKTGSYGIGGGSTPSALAFGTQTANYSLVNTDNNKVVRMNSSTNLEVYVTASNFSSGDQVIVFQSGSGQVTFIPNFTTEILSANNMRKLRTQYSAATLTFTGNTCYLFGDIAP